jgi:hypothetical protein
MNSQYTSVDPYKNANVEEILAQLGLFEYNVNVPSSDNLEFKPLNLLETGAQYEGEFIKGTDMGRWFSLRRLLVQ